VWIDLAERASCTAVGCTESSKVPSFGCPQRGSKDEARSLITGAFIMILNADVAITEQALFL
jgi:hypothetical protein